MFHLSNYIDLNLTKLLFVNSHIGYLVCLNLPQPSGRAALGIPMRQSSYFFSGLALHANETSPPPLQGGQGGVMLGLRVDEKIMDCI